MQLKSLLGFVVLLSNVTLLTYGRAVELSRSDISTVELRHKTNIHHVVEPRVFKAIGKKIGDKIKATNNGEDRIGDDGPTDVPTIPPPAKYTGPIPNGMGQEPELSEWKKFLDREIDSGRNAPVTGRYLMYSGESISSLQARDKFKNAAKEDTKTGDLKDWDDTFAGTPALNMWTRYQKLYPDKRHVASFAVSFAQARRAAQSMSELHMLFSSKNEPLMKDKSFWGAVEAGIITGPDSKVNKIWRYNDDEINEGEPLPPLILAWDRNLHEPFGKKIDELGWRIYPKGPGQPDGKLDTAVPKSPPRQIGTLPFEQ